MGVNPREASHSNSIRDADRYQLLVDGIQDYAVFLLDASGYIETWNSGGRNITGYTEDDVINKHFSVFYTPSDVATNRPDKELLRTTQYGRTEEENWRVRKDGTRFWANTITTALYNNHGSLIGFAKVTRDITDRKQSKDELIVAHRQLKQQHNELEALSNIKDEFISLASHQLRTPATGIKQYLGMLLEGYVGHLTKKQILFIQKAYDGNERQIGLVNSLLRTAQIDAGKVTLNKSYVDLHAMIDDVVDSLSDVFKGRNQTIEIVEKVHLPEVCVDKSQFRMVMENIIDNASKYTDSGGRIGISLSDTKAHVIIAVTDTGVGIATKDVRHVFDKFNRIPNKLSDSVGGSGLGLYWVKKIIKLHGGTIHVNSKIDVGTTFKIALPKKDLYV